MRELPRTVKFRVVTWSVLACLAATVAASAKEPVATFGVPEILRSKVLEEDRTLAIHLPEDYDSGEQRYPVLYMMGSEYRTRFALWAANLDYLSGTGRIPAMILVGIDLPEGNGVLVPRDGDASGPDRYLRFLAEEVVPHVDGKYRTVSYRALFGASNSGLFAVYALLSAPGSFSAYLASSPMLGWCPDLLEERAAGAFGGAADSGRFLYLIWSDDDYEHATEAVPPFIQRLETGKPDWLSYRSVERSGEGHVPATDAPLALQALFPDYRPAAEADTLDALQDHYGALTKRYGFTLEIPQSVLFDKGIEHVIAGRLDPAQAMFEYAVTAYPDRSRSHVGLGLVRREQDRLDEARKRFLKALELDPEDSLARRLLERLEEMEKSRQEESTGPESRNDPE